MSFREWVWIAIVIAAIVGSSAFLILLSVKGLVLPPTPP
jgi:hypothetical protein